ncbi:MAG: GNAT family N-acetyltransferase [Deltaproteobacteria bacterium]|nr:GNAT family N-acetyltransferase [Deltaproteobacteria bacterium]
MSGAALGAVANSEPAAGTDIMSLRAIAEPDAGGGFRLFARKRSITNVSEADVALCSARIAGVDAKRALNIFLVETTTPRVYARRLDDMAGLRTSPTGHLLVRRARLDASALLGELGGGVDFFRYCFSLERLLIGHLYLAAIRRCQARAIAFVSSKDLGKHQYVQEKIVRMRVAEELLESELQRTLARFSRGEDVFAALSVVKIYGVDAAMQAAQDLIGLLGSAGMQKREPAEKDLRDLLGLSILGGTAELQKIVVYSETMKRAKESAKASARDPLGVRVSVHPRAEICDALAKELVAFVAAVMPNEPALAGKYYFDTPPDFVLIARAGERIAGIRVLVRRVVWLEGREVQLAGIGVAVHPDHRGRGVGTALTRRALEIAEQQGAELVLAFLLNRNAESLLARYGFRRLNAAVSYLDSKSGGLVQETMPGYAKGLRGSAIVDEIEARGTLHLGAGTW